MLLQGSERLPAIKPTRVNGRATAAKRAGVYSIAKSAWAAKRVKVARSEGCRKRVRSAEVARDTEASETCKRLCVLPEGLAWRRRKLSLRGRLCIAMWITRRGVNRHGLPGDYWRATVWRDRIWRGMQEVCRMLDGAARWMKRGHKNKDPETELERRHRPVQQTSLLLEKEGGVWWTGLYLIS